MVIVYAIERLPPRFARPAKLITLVLVLLGLSYSTLFDSVLRELRRPAAQRTAASDAPPWFGWVDHLQSGSRIAADTSTEDGLGGGALIWYFYPLFGDRFQRRVFPLAGQTDAAIARGLLAKRIGYLIVGSGGPYAGFTRRAARRACLRPLFADETVRAYQVERKCLQKAPP